jgi:hypothetical protein
MLSGQARVIDGDTIRIGQMTIGQTEFHKNHNQAVADIFPNHDTIKRLVGALLLEQNDEWAVQRTSYMMLESAGQLSDDPVISQPRRGALISPASPERTATNAASYTTRRDTAPI